MARELIGSRTKGFRLGSVRAYLPRSSSTAASSLDNYVPLEAQLAFNRKDISGSSYKSIVDRALETAPGYAQKALLIEQSKAMERAQQEGRRLRQLQAEVKAASTPGKTAQDAINLYNFWYEEAEKAAKEGDQEYSLQALKNAGSARDLAERRGRGESSKAYANVTANFNKEDDQFEDAYRIIENAYQTGTRRGEEADGMLSALLRVRVGDLKQRLLDLAQLQKQGVTRLGRTDIQTLIESASDTLYGNVGVNGTSGGLIGLERKVTQRAANAASYADIVDRNSDGSFELVRGLRPVNTNESVYVRDDLGRYVKLQKGYTPEGDVFLFADIPDPSGVIRRIQTSPTPDSGENIAELMASGVTFTDLTDPSNPRELKNLGAIKPELGDTFNVFGKEADYGITSEQLNPPPAPEISFLDQVKQHIPNISPYLDQAKNFFLPQPGKDTTGGNFQLAKDYRGQTITLPPPAPVTPGTPQLPSSINPGNLAKATAVQGPIKLPAKIDLKAPVTPTKSSPQINPGVLSSLNGPDYGPVNPNKPPQEDNLLQKGFNLLKGLFRF